MAQPYGLPQSPVGGGGSFLGTAAAAAAGVVGGSLLLGSIRNMMGGMGGNHQSFGDNSPSSSVEDRRPWAESDSDLARDAGINDIGSARTPRDDGSRAPACSTRRRTTRPITTTWIWIPTISAATTATATTPDPSRRQHVKTAASPAAVLFRREVSDARYQITITRAPTLTRP